MNAMAFSDASAVRRKIQLAAMDLLDRPIGSSLTLDAATGEWVINLAIPDSLSAEGVRALDALAKSHGIRLAWLDHLEPARLAVG